MFQKHLGWKYFYLYSNLSQDGEVDAALVSGRLGTGAARGEQLLHPAPTSTSLNLKTSFLSISQVKHVLAGSEYSATAAGREEKALYFGDEVDEKKYTSCKPRGNDPRFCFYP